MNISSSINLADMMARAQGNRSLPVLRAILFHSPSSVSEGGRPANIQDSRVAHGSDSVMLWKEPNPVDDEGGLFAQVVIAFEER